MPTAVICFRWDTDQFNTDVRELTLAMVSIPPRRWAWHGGFNFDAKTPSPVDRSEIFSTLTSWNGCVRAGSQIARRILADGKFETFLQERYSSFDSGYGRDIDYTPHQLPQLEKLVLTKLGEPIPRSGKQEYLENLLTRYLHD